jgi:hypothetical protein
MDPMPRMPLGGSPEPPLKLIPDAEAGARIGRIGIEHRAAVEQIR